MHQRGGRLSITFGRLNRSRDQSLHSATSPKSTEPSPRLQTTSATHTEYVSSPPNRQSLPPSTATRPQAVQRVMTEPVRPPPVAVTSRPRSISHPPTPNVATVPPSSSGRPPTRTPTQRTNTSTKPQGRFRRVLTALKITKQSKQKPSEPGRRRHFPLIVALLVFCFTAIVCIYLLLLEGLIDRHRHGIFVTKLPQFHTHLLHWVVVLGIRVCHPLSPETR